MGIRLLTLKDRSQKIPLILSLDAHRHDDGVDPRLLEIGVEETFEPSVPFVEVRRKASASAE
jgi:hypothetical protein